MLPEVEQARVCVQQPNLLHAWIQAGFALARDFADRACFGSKVLFRADRRPTDQRTQKLRFNFRLCGYCARDFGSARRRFGNSLRREREGDILQRMPSCLFRGTPELQD